MFSFLNPWVLIGLAVAMAASAGSGWHARTVYQNAQEREQLVQTIETMQVDAKKSREISEGVQVALSNMKIVNRTIRNEVQREIIEKEIYRDRNCSLPESGRLRLDAAIDTANRAGRLDAIVPDPAKASGQLAR